MISKIPHSLDSRYREVQANNKLCALNRRLNRGKGHAEYEESMKVTNDLKISIIAGQSRIQTYLATLT